VPDLGWDFFSSDESLGLLDEEFLGLDPNGIPTEFASQCGDDSKTAAPFAKEVPDREILCLDRLHRSPNVPEVAGDVLFDRPTVPRIPIGLEKYVSFCQQGFDFLRDYRFAVPSDLQESQLRFARGVADRGFRGRSFGHRRRLFLTFLMRRCLLDILNQNKIEDTPQARSSDLPFPPLAFL